MLDHSKEGLLHELEAAGAEIKGDGREIICPFHEDKHASGGVYEGDDGIWRYKCHAASCGFCGDAFDVLSRAENKPLGDVLKEQDPKSIANLRRKRDAVEKSEPRLYETVEAIEAIVPGKLEARYTYTNPNTRKADLIVLRYQKNGKKAFWQVSPRPGGWILQRPDGFLPLYNRLELAQSGSVLVVEGEKCVHAARSARYCATTSPMGAGKASYAEWSPLAGKTVYLWPDNDQGGIKHMEEIASIIDHLDPPTRTYWIDPAGLRLPPKGDIADFIAGKNPAAAHEAVAAVVESSLPRGAARELSARMEATIDGRLATIPWPWPVLTQQTKALMPGTVTLFCGAPGASKSFALLQCLRFWYENGVKAVVFELEEDRAYHLNRLLAQECERPDLMDTDWVRAHPSEAREDLARHEELLDEIGRRIYAAPDEQIDYPKLVAWTEARARDKARIIVIDPVTAVTPTRDVWVADSEFIFKIKTIAREHDCSVILVTHPRKGSKGKCGLDDLAGGAAFQRFNQTLLWLESFQKPKMLTVRTPCGRDTIKCNRVLHMAKVRNGPGHGAALGLIWKPNALKLAEQGLILSEKGEKANKDDPTPDDLFPPREPGEGE